MVMIFPLLSHLQAIETNYYPTQAVQTKQCVLSDKCFLSTRAIFLLISFHDPCFRKQETTETKTIPSYPVKGRGRGSRSNSNISYLDYEEPTSPPLRIVGKPCKVGTCMRDFGIVYRKCTHKLTFRKFL